MNVAVLAQVYANYIKPGGGSEAKKAKRYSCWAQTQVCYSLTRTYNMRSYIVKRSVATAAGRRDAGMSLPHCIGTCTMIGMSCFCRHHYCLATVINVQKFSHCSSCVHECCPVFAA